jgi:hypothetical protein
VIVIEKIEQGEQMHGLVAHKDGKHLRNGPITGKKYPISVLINAPVRYITVNPDGTIELELAEIKTIIK